MHPECPICGCQDIAYEQLEEMSELSKCCNDKCLHSWRAVPVERVAVAKSPQSAPVAPPSAVSSRGPKAQRFDVLREARKRLRELDSEIRRIEKLKAERDKLARLLAAADSPDGSVIPIRRRA